MNRCWNSTQLVVRCDQNHPAKTFFADFNPSMSAAGVDCHLAPGCAEIGDDLWSMRLRYRDLKCRTQGARRRPRIPQRHAE
jgi:hypothetical protein